jgi:TolA-binding protein
LADQFPNDPARAVASYFVGQGNVKRSGLNDSAIQYIMKVQRYLDLLLSWGAN